MEDNTSAKFEFLASFILPNGILDWFDFVKANEEPVEKKDCIYKSTLHIYLDEKHRYPEGYQEGSLTSKGFRDEIVIQVFPIRRKDTFLHVRRRKWLVESTGEVISNTFDLAAKGTRYSDEFAFFLKGLLGYLPDKFKQP